MRRCTRLITVSILLYATTAFGGRLDQPSNQTKSTDAKTRVDACSLIKSEELLAVQGEATKETRPSENANGSLATGQCLYILPTYSKSLSLSLTQRDASKGQGVKLKELWEEKFRAFEEEEEKGSKSKEKNSGEKEEKGESRPVRIEGVGEEAFWVGNRMLGALYVLSKNSILRLSLGGPEDDAAKISKLKMLARKAIKRL
jgi:hypothetical protein